MAGPYSRTCVFGCVALVLVILAGPALLYFQASNRVPIEVGFTFAGNGAWQQNGVDIHLIAYFTLPTEPAHNPTECAHQCRITAAKPESSKGANDGHPACNAFSFATMGAPVASDTPGSCATYAVTAPGARPGGSYKVPTVSYLHSHLIRLMASPPGDVTN